MLHCRCGPTPYGKRRISTDSLQVEHCGFQLLRGHNLILDFCIKSEMNFSSCPLAPAFLAQQQQQQLSFSGQPLLFQLPAAQRSPGGPKHTPPVPFASCHFLFHLAESARQGTPKSSSSKHHIEPLTGVAFPEADQQGCQLVGHG